MCTLGMALYVIQTIIYLIASLVYVTFLAAARIEGIQTWLELYIDIIMLVISFYCFKKFKVILFTSLYNLF